MNGAVARLGVGGTGGKPCPFGVALPLSLELVVSSARAGLCTEGTVAP